MRFLLLLVLSCQTAATAAVALRSGCDESDSVVANVDENTPLRVNSAIAGGPACYLVTAVAGGQKITGYTVNSKLPAVIAFENERQSVFRRAVVEAAALPPAAAPALAEAAPLRSRFPDFAARDLSGKPVSLAGQRAKLVVVTFWSPSHPRTLSQLTSLRGLYAEFHPAGLEAIGVAMTSSEGAARAALEDTDLEWPQISDRMGLARSLNINANQAKTFVLDADRNIVASDLQGSDLTALVNKMLHSGVNGGQISTKSVQ